MNRKRARNAPWELDPSKLRDAMLRRVERSTELQTELAFAAIPALLDHYFEKCERLFEVAGRPLEASQRTQFRALLAQALQTGFEASAHAKVVVRGTTDPPPAMSLSYQIGVRTREIADVYAAWLRAGSAPYFGTHPDAKLTAIAKELAAHGGRALDIGAGTGRNSLPLARVGFEVDAVEITPGFVAELRKTAEDAALPIRVIEGDAFDPTLAIAASRYVLIVASEVVSSHVRDAAELREFFAFVAEKLADGGLLLCNLFVARTGYVPDVIAQQVSPAVLSAVFSQAELERSSAELGLERISDESCLAYEKEHLPREAWPPTVWFEAWANGGNLFDLDGRAPCELRWLVFRKGSSAITSQKHASAQKV